MWDLTRAASVPLVIESTPLRLQFSFLQGTYNPNTGTATIDSCLPCDAGSFCKQPGLNATEGKCFAGYYCTGRSPSPTPVSSHQWVDLQLYNQQCIYLPQNFLTENVGYFLMLLLLLKWLLCYCVTVWILCSVFSIVRVMSFLNHIIHSTRKLPDLNRWKIVLSCR